MYDIDFLNFKTLFRYLFLFALILIGGAFLKDIASISILFIIIGFALFGKIYRSIEFFLIWFFCSGFYYSQDFFSFSIISKFSKPSLILLLIFIILYNKIKDDIKPQNLVLGICLFQLSTEVSALINSQSLVIVGLLPFFLLYFILKGIKIEPRQYHNLFNLFVAVGIVQFFVSILQVAQLIPPPSIIMDDGNGGTFLWEAGLDDAACGTFGAVSSHLVSWYEALITIFLFLIWVIKPRIKYLLVIGICILQFTTVDSKTILFVFVLMFMYLFFFYLNKNKKFLRINLSKLLLIISMISIMGLVVIKAWNYYYHYYSEQTGTTTRENLGAVYENLIVDSKDVIITNISDWGKIRGFQYVFDDFLKEGLEKVLFGYGLEGYSYNGKMSLIESKDTPIMQLNNFTNSRSGLITLFATLGLVGFSILCAILRYWFKENVKVSSTNELYLVKKALITNFFLFSILAAFLYSVRIDSITIVAFGGLIGLLSGFLKNNQLNKTNYGRLL